MALKARDLLRPHSPRKAPSLPRLARESAPSRLRRPSRKLLLPREA